MVDIHSHVLPGVDDGARSLEESLEMLEVARSAGTTTIVASPHADTQFTFDPERVDTLINQLQSATTTGVKIIRGCDFHLMISNVDDAVRYPNRYAIAGKSYLLMELSDLTIFPNTSDLWRRLEDAGLTIILTHPERNPLLRQRLELIQEWVEQGRLMQVTAQSLLGLFGPKAQTFARQLLDRGLVHFLASDGHDPKRRPPRLDEGYEWLCRHYSRPLADLLCVDHPQAVIDGRSIDLKDFPPKPATGGFWSKLFGSKLKPS